MKKIIIIALAALTFLAGCELERFPYNYYSADKILSDKETALDALLNGCYARLRNSSENLHRTGEYPGDNMAKDKRTTDPFGTYITYDHAPNNSRLSNVWNDAYKIISQASDLIKLIDEGESAEVDQKLGEAYYMRGLMYFYLCRVFGRPYYQDADKNLGLPIVNGMPDDVVNMELPDRSSVKDTYAQAVADLRKAEQLMTIFKDPCYASKYAAQAMLAKIYMYMSGTYESPNQTFADSSYYFANQVIQHGPFELLDRETFKKYNEYAPDNDVQTETIFAVRFRTSDGTNYSDRIGSMYARIQGVGWGEIYASEKLLDLLYETGRGNDAREAFIQPQYAEDEDGNLTPVLRFVTNTYNTAGALSGYIYKQFEITARSGNRISVNAGTNDSPQIIEATLENAARKTYRIQYEGREYVGYEDYQMLENEGLPRFYVYKCSLQEGVAQLHSPIISRLAEIYLIRAEASAKMGNYQSALTDVNTVRGRSLDSPYLYTSMDATNAKEFIMKERQLELSFEGDRGFDVFRVGDTMVRRYPGWHDGTVDVAPTSPRVVQYLPQSEINAYPNLTQNP